MATEAEEVSSRGGKSKKQWTLIDQELEVLQRVMSKLWKRD